MAIQANELRLNNLVRDRDGKIIRIDFFEHLENGYSCKFGMNNPLSDDFGPLHPFTEYTDYANPIPLTPEILTEWCGFMPQSKNDVFVKTWGRNGIFIVQHDILQNEFYAQFSQFYRLHLKSLHHLQNVFYVHAGQELPVNIPGNH